mmetsp:Transcript_41303/g.95631  ORF Transcript_41303/g.95631 Transcript_41303/m.95631 type:complete len:201 (-) Transcript_41303:575-1177(-)
MELQRPDLFWLDPIHVHSSDMQFQFVCGSSFSLITVVFALSSVLAHGLPRSRRTTAGVSSPIVAFPSSSSVSPLRAYAGPPWSWCSEPSSLIFALSSSAGTVVASAMEPSSSARMASSCITRSWPGRGGVLRLGMVTFACTSSGGSSSPLSSTSWSKGFHLPRPAETLSASSVPATSSRTMLCSFGTRVMQASRAVDARA